MLSIEEIERLRKVNGIRKSALTERAGINATTYNNMLKPMRRGPTIGSIERLEAALLQIIEESPATSRRA